MNATDPIIHHPFAFDFGFFEFTGFGLAVVMAFVIAQIVAQRLLAERGHDPEPIGDLIFAAVIGGIVGAKLYYAFIVGEPSDFFSRAGFVFWGGLIGGIITVSAVAMHKKLSLLRIADVAGPSIAAAHAIGRTGCWAVGDDYGLPWNGFLAVAFPEGAPPSTATNLSSMFGVDIPLGVAPNAVLAVHPTQIYEVVLLTIAFLILWRLRNHRHAEGWLFGVYAVLAGIERFVIEFVRAKDDRVFYETLTIAQVIAIAFIIGGIAWMAYTWRSKAPARATGA